MTVNGRRFNTKLPDTTHQRKRSSNTDKTRKHRAKPNKQQNNKMGRWVFPTTTKWAVDISLTAAKKTTPTRTAIQFLMEGKKAPTRPHSTDTDSDTIHTKKRQKHQHHDQYT